VKNLEVFSSTYVPMFIMDGGVVSYNLNARFLLVSQMTMGSSFQPLSNLNYVQTFCSGFYVDLVA
jgi:hypothetical protein